MAAKPGEACGFQAGLRTGPGGIPLPFDSDDACIPEALERFKFHRYSIPTEQKPLFSGICGLCKDQYGRFVGNRFPLDIMDSDSLEIHYRYGVKGEKWGFQRSEVLGRYPFPDVEGARYIPEGVVWNSIAKSCKTRFVNETLRTYCTEKCVLFRSNYLFIKPPIQKHSGRRILLQTSSE